MPLPISIFYYSMKSLIFLILVGVALGLRLNSDSYITLPSDGYLFTCSPASAIYRIAINQLPRGLALQGNRLVAVQGVQAGQYILSVVATDDQGNRDEQIVIVNIDGSIRPVSLVSSAGVRGQGSSSSSASVTSSSGPSAAAVAAAASSSQVTELREAFGQSTVNTAQSASATTSTTTSTTTNSNSNSQPEVSNFDIDALQQLFSTDTNSDFAPADSASTTFTSASSSTASFTSPNVPASTSSASPTDLASILSDYSTTSTASTLDFSQFESPDVGNPELRNFLTQNQLTTEPSAQVYTQEEVDEMFRQQRQATEWVKGNYTIVQQVTANKNMANALIQQITQQYQADRQRQEDIRTRLEKVSLNKTKIESAVANLNDKSTGLDEQIAATQGQRSVLVGRKDEISAAQRQTEEGIAGLEQRLLNVRGQITLQNGSLGDSQVRCNRLSSSLTEVKTDLNVKRYQKALTLEQITSAENDVQERIGVVEELRRRLREAEEALALSQQSLSDLNTRSVELDQEITETAAAISRVEFEVQTCREDHGSLGQGLIDLRREVTVIEGDIADSRSQLQSQMNQMSTIDMQISEIDGQLGVLGRDKQSTVDSLAILQQALPEATAQFRSLLAQKRQIDILITHSEESLNAAIARFKAESEELRVAQMHLQNARAISEQADMKVNEMLAIRGSLPYAVGVEASNQLLLGQTVISNQISIDNWFNFISANFGNAGLLFMDDAVSQLYAFECGDKSLSAAVGTALAAYDPSDLVSVSGRIVQVVSPGEIVIERESGARMRVQVADGAILYSSTAGYEWTVGDGIMVRGSIESEGQITAVSIVCLH